MAGVQQALCGQLRLAASVTASVAHPGCCSTLSADSQHLFDWRNQKVNDWTARWMETDTHLKIIADFSQKPHRYGLIIRAAEVTRKQWLHMEVKHQVLVSSSFVSRGQTQYMATHKETTVWLQLKAEGDLGDVYFKCSAPFSDSNI